MADTNFQKWFDTFIQEKGIDTDQLMDIPGPSGSNLMPLGIVTDTIRNSCPKQEQCQIKGQLIFLDFNNADIVDYFKHLAQAIAI